MTNKLLELVLSHTDINKTSKHNYACMVKAAEAGTVFILQIAEYLSID